MASIDYQRIVSLRREKQRVDRQCREKCPQRWNDKGSEGDRKGIVMEESNAGWRESHRNGKGRGGWSPLKVSVLGKEHGASDPLLPEEE